jgi:hypothetical protein
VYASVLNSFSKPTKHREQEQTFSPSPRAPAEPENQSNTRTAYRTGSYGHLKKIGNDGGSKLPPPFIIVNDFYQVMMAIESKLLI